MHTGKAVMLAVLGAALALALVPARAEVEEVRIAHQYGVAYLPLLVMEREHLIEAQLRRQGMPVPRVTWVSVAGSGVSNDGLLGGSLHFATFGTPSLAQLWAKTRDAQGIRGVAAITSCPVYLNSRNPRVHSVRDLGEGDRIAVPAVKISYQALLLQMLAAREFGPDQYARLDPLTVGLAHPDALLAFTNGTGGVNAHFASSPYHEQEMRIPGTHTIATSTDILGGRSSCTLLAGSSRFRTENPRTYRAVLDALTEAIARINRDKAAAARTYLEIVHDARETPAELERSISGPDYAYTTTPEKVFRSVEFLHRIGVLKTRPGSWKDLFFPEIHGAPGD